MNRRYTFFIFLLTLLISTQASFSQTYSETARKQKKELTKLAGEFRTHHKKNFKLAHKLAKEKGWFLYQVDKNGTVTSLQGVDGRNLPIYYTTNNNIYSAATIGTNQLWPGGTSGLNLSGSKGILKDKLALWDGGSVRLTHNEFQNRVKLGDGGSSFQDHSTHVAGTMIASGINSNAKGMSFRLPSLLSFDFDNDNAEMADAVAKYNLLVSNHSYGDIAGWRENLNRAGTSTDPVWEWWGEEGKTEDYKFGIYNAGVAAWDQIAFNAPYYLIIKSAGNNQNQNGPAIGQPYYQRNAGGVFTLKTARQANAISNNDSYDNLSTNCNAKNIMVVGATYGLINGYLQAGDVRLAPFSSWGPTDDGRIKPDVVADGVNILSTFSGSDNAYGTLSGTSMAAPSVSGSAMLLQEHFSNLNNGNFMRSATLRGLIIHSTNEAGPTPGPDYKYGWGLMNAAKAAKIITENGTYSLIAEKTLNQGEAYEFKVTASGREPLSVTICWTDPAGTATADGVVDNNDLKLVNDLDVKISKNNTTFLPWILDPNQPANKAEKGDNFRDNVEKILIENTEPGEIYTVRVTHKGTLKDGKQAYSIIATGIGGQNYCASTATSTTGLKISEVNIGSFVNQSADCTGYSNFLTNAIVTEANTSLPLSVTLGNCTTSSSGFIKVFVDWNSNGNFDDANELVATSPSVSTAAIYTTQILVPSTVSPDDILRMRIVVQETNQSSTINACGSYNSGETEDYAIKINPPSNDVGVSSIVAPANGDCGNTNQKVSLLIKNYGLVAQKNIPVKAEITLGGQLIKTLTATVTQTIQSGQEASFTFPETFTSTAGNNYTIKAGTSLSTDQQSPNNELTNTISISVNPSAPVLEAFACDGNNTLLKSNTTEGTVFWFDSENATQPIAAGNDTFTTLPLTKVYGALNDFSGKIGPTTKYQFDRDTINTYNQFTPSIKLTAYAPLVLERARLYIGHSGTITFTVTNEQTGEEVSSTILNVTATRNPEGIGSQINDFNDTGAVYDLNLKIPAAGDYLINISYGNDATIFRTKQTKNPIAYPVVIPNVLSINGNTASSSGGVGSQNYWYYLYDIEVKALGCKSPRTAVTVGKPVIELRDNVLYSSSPTSNQWYLNDIAIKDATEPSYKPIYSGNYTVKLINACTATSNQIAYKLPVVPEDINLKLFPVPASDKLTVEFNVWEPSSLQLSVINSLGQIFADETITNFSGPITKEYPLDAYTSGVYFFRVIIGSNVYTGKFSVIK